VKREIGMVVSVALLAFAVGIRARPPAEVVYERVEVPVEVIIEREPDTIRTFVDRIRTVEVQPIQVAISPAAVVREVAAFCAPTVPLFHTDTVYVLPDTQLLLRSVTHKAGWFISKDQILLTGMTNYGDLVAMDYAVRDGFTARATGNDVLVQHPRMGLLRDITEIVIIAGITFVITR
jgi:hypothetical protein